MKLRGVGADDVKEVREIVQHLFTNIVKPARSKPDSRQAIDKHAKYTTTELDRSRPVKKGAAKRGRLGEEVAVNMHTMGTSFDGLER